MPSIEIDDDVWGYLQGKAVPFQDNPNDVLRREFGLGATQARSADSSRTPAIKASILGRTQTDSVQVVPPRPSGIAKNYANFDTFRPDRDYTYYLVRGYQLEGKHVGARSF